MYYLYVQYNGLARHRETCRHYLSWNIEQGVFQYTSVTRVTAWECGINVSYWWILNWEIRPGLDYCTAVIFFTHPDASKISQQCKKPKQTTHIFETAQILRHYFGSTSQWCRHEWCNTYVKYEAGRSKWYHLIYQHVSILSVIVLQLQMIKGRRPGRICYMF